MKITNIIGNKLPQPKILSYSKRGEFNLLTTIILKFSLTCPTSLLIGGTQHEIFKFLNGK